MIRLILQHWAFHSYVVWVLIVGIVILLGKVHVGSIAKWWRNRRESVPTPKLNAAALYPPENAVEDLRITAVKFAPPRWDTARKPRV